MLLLIRYNLMQRALLVGWKNTMTSDYDILICGGGMIGSALASLLAPHGSVYYTHLTLPTTPYV